MKKSPSLLLASSLLLLMQGAPVPALAQVELHGSKTPPVEAQPKSEPEVFNSKLKLLDKAELDKLLAKRLNGSVGMDFGPFANMFFVRSKIDTDVSIGLATNSPEITKAHLEAAFPSDYKPTLRELLDVIALQSNSRWAYNPEGQVIKTDSPSDQTIDGIAIFEFIPESKELPLEITPAKSWKAERRTNWIMYVPPNVPLAMDLHVLGQLSCDDKSKEAELFAKAPQTVAIETFKRVKSTAATRDLQKSKVGPYDAYFFEHNLTMKSGQSIHWRQWYFMAGDRLCFVISTIPKELDAELYLDVEAMLKTVRAADKH